MIGAQMVLSSWANFSPAKPPVESWLLTRTYTGVLPDLNWTTYVPSPRSAAELISTDVFTAAKPAREARK